MTTTTDTKSAGNTPSIWKRAYNLIKAYEDASEYTPVERTVILLEQKVSRLENTIHNLKERAH